MRNGKLLAEDSPTVLMNRYNTYILEDIVVQLCLRDESTTGGSGVPSPSPNESTKVSGGMKENGSTGSSSTSSLPRSHLDEPDLNSILDQVDLRPLKRRPSLGEILHRASTDAYAIKKYDFKTEAKEKMERIYALLMKNVLVLIRNYVYVLKFNLAGNYILNSDSFVAKVCFVCHWPPVESSCAGLSGHWNGPTWDQNRGSE